MSFPIPPKVKITSKCSYEVVWVDAFDCPNTLAECRFDRKQIAIKTGQGEVDTLKSFIHEVMHAIDHEYKMALSHKTIYALENNIYRILALNGWAPKKERKSK